jgi:CHAT domain-containing protein
VYRGGADVSEQVEPGSEITELAQLQSRIATLTDFTIQGLSQISDRIAQLPDTSETVESRIHYAQTLLRLKQVADESDRVDTQLRSHLKAILGQVQKIYAIPEYKGQLPPRATIDPVFRKITGEFQRPQRSLFLTKNLRSRLQSQVKGSLQQATQILTPAIATAHTLKNTRIEAAAEVLLADVYGLSADLKHTSNQWAAVETLSQRAMQLIQVEDAPDLILRAQQQYARSLIKQSKTTAAQAACRVAASTLQANRSNLVAIDQDVQYSFLESVDPFYRECVTTLLPQGSEARIQDNLKDARNLIEALQLAELDNFFRESCIEGRKTGIDTLVEDQKSLNTAVIYPILLSKREVGVIAKLPNIKELQYYSSGLLNENVEKVLFQLSTQITDISQSRGYQTQALSKTVYDWLIAPLRQQLKTVDTLVFVPDAAFRNVPMAALYDGQRYLIDDFAIALSPGLQLIKPQTNDQTILSAIGAGLIDVPDKYQLNKFPKAAIDQEFNSMRKAGILSQEPLLENAFTSLELANQLEKSSFNVVHLSTHAGFSSQKDKTYVLMANGRVNVDEFSAVLRKRVEQQKGAIELLVLSACQTVSGDNRAALGLAGIAIKSGARSTLATLWTVDTAATASFIESFYQEYVNSATRTAKQTKAKAVQTAQIRLKQETNDPSIWASYVLVGNWL